MQTARIEQLPCFRHLRDAAEVGPVGKALLFAPALLADLFCSIPLAIYNGRIAKSHHPISLPATPLTPSGEKANVQFLQRVFQNQTDPNIKALLLSFAEEAGKLPQSFESIQEFRGIVANLAVFEYLRLMNNPQIDLDTDPIVNQNLVRLEYSSIEGGIHKLCRAFEQLDAPKNEHDLVHVNQRLIQLILAFGDAMPFEVAEENGLVFPSVRAFSDPLHYLNASQKNLVNRIRDIGESVAQEPAFHRALDQILKR